MKFKFKFFYFSFILLLSALYAGQDPKDHSAPQDSSECSDFLEGDSLEKIIEKILQAQPLNLMQPTLKQGIEAFLKELQSISPRFSEFEEIRKKLAAGVDERMIHSELMNFFMNLIQEAKDIQPLKEKNPQEYQKRMEGYRLLLTQAIQMLQKVEKQIKEKEKKKGEEEEEEKKKKDGKKDKKGKMNKQKGDQQKSEDSGDSSENESDSDSDSEDSEQEGNQNPQSGKGSSNSQKALKDLSEAIEQFLKKQQENAQKKSNSNNEKKDLSADDKSDKDDEQEKTEQDKSQNSKQKDKKDSENKSDSKDGKGEGKSKQPKELDSRELNELLETFLQILWREVLEEYSDVNALKNGLSQYIALCKQLQGNLNSVSFIPYYKVQAEKLLTQIENLELSHRSLKDSALEISTGGAKAGREIQFLKIILGALKKAKNLNSYESEILNFLNQLQPNRIKSEQESIDQLRKALSSQLPGPLSRGMLKELFDKDPKDFFKKLERGELRKYLLLSALKNYLIRTRISQFKPKKSTEWIQPKPSRNDEDPELTQAQELEHFSYFFRDAPPQYDITRLLSGDLLQKSYPKEDPSDLPDQRIPRKITIILRDVSGSMSGEKELFSNTLTGVILDQAQQDVQAKLADHVVYDMPFNDKVLHESRIENRKEFEEKFAQMMNVGSVTNGGTSITNALVHAYEKILEHQQKYGELAQASIVLITDGEDHVNASEIAAVRDQLNPETQVSLNTYNLESHNTDLEELSTRLKKSGSSSNFEKVMYEFLSRETMKELLNHSNQAEELKNAAQFFNTDSKQSIVLTSQQKQTIRQLLLSLSSLREQQALSVKVFQELSQLFDRTNQQTPKTSRLDSVFEKFIEYVASPLSKHWSREKRSQIFFEFMKKLEKYTLVSSKEILEHVSTKYIYSIKKWVEKK